jgi:glutathione S-transferase
MSVTEQKSAAYLKINKRGQVPVLIADGEVIVENLAIQNYIAKTFPEVPTRAHGCLGRISLALHAGLDIQLGPSERQAHLATVLFCD